MGIIAKVAIIDSNTLIMSVMNKIEMICEDEEHRRTNMNKIQNGESGGYSRPNPYRE